MTGIPQELQSSKALQFIQSQGWNWKFGNSPNIELETCPLCKKTGYGHCYMEVHGAEDPQATRDSLWQCQRCGKSGNLYSLQKTLGHVVAGVASQKSWAREAKKVDPLPDVDACHQALLEDMDALDYLMNIRGFSLNIIKKRKIGLEQDHYFRETGKVRALVYPYLVNGNIVWAHFRTLPDPSDLKKVPKAFSSPTGWDSQLYNGEILKQGLKEVVLVEGEPDCIAALDHNVVNICGVPGANIKKASWIETLDTIGLEKIYICYDNDKVGNRAAQALASRIGIERCYKLILPNFSVVTESGETRQGKDLNEWFTQGGGSVEDFENLKNSAELFDVDGVANGIDAIDEFTEDLEGKGAGQKYIWPLISNIVQFDEGDCIDILAPEKVGKTKFALNLIEYMVDTYNEDGVFICLEMTRARLARNWVCHKAGIADNLPKTVEEAETLTAIFKDAIPKVKEMIANREGDLYFCYPKYKSVEDIYKLIIDIIRRYGVKWIVLDNIQRLADTTPRGSKSRTEHLSEISKMLSQICKDYGVQMIRILQPHRIADGKMVNTDSVDGASQIAKDCDAMLVLNRARVGEISKADFATGMFMESEITFGPEMLVSAGLSRYSAGGCTTVYFNGATSTVSKLTEGKIAAMNDSQNVGYQALNKAMNYSPTSASTVPANSEDGEIQI